MTMNYLQRTWLNTALGKAMLDAEVPETVACDLLIEQRRLKHSPDYRLPVAGEPHYGAVCLAVERLIDQSVKYVQLTSLHCLLTEARSTEVHNG